VDWNLSKVKILLPALCFEKTEEIDIESEQTLKKGMTTSNSTYKEKNNVRKVTALIKNYGKDLSMEKLQRNDIQGKNDASRRRKWHTETNNVSKKTMLTTHSPRQGSQNRKAEKMTLKEGTTLPETEKRHAETKHQ
jgi:hypothetical protein